MTVETSKPNIKFIAPLALAVGVVALGLSVFTFVKTTHNRTESQLQALETSVTSVSQDSTGRAVELQKQIAELKTTMPLSSQKILAEVSFLATVANTQLTINFDAGAAARTLSVAQALIASSNDAHFIGLSTAIAADREALYAVPALKQSQLFTEISALIQKIQGLSTLPQTQAITVNTAIPVQDATKPWYQKFLEVLSQLKGLVIIRHVNENNPPLVAPNMELNLKQNITTQLTMAQWALLHHNAAIYQSALQNANEWTTRYFALTAGRDGVSASLTQLMTVNITPVLPALTNTLAALTQVNLLPTDSVKGPDLLPPGVVREAAPSTASPVPAATSPTIPQKLPAKPNTPNSTSVET